MIIETSANRFYRVHETGSADLAHCWYGIEVRKDRKSGEWKQKARISHPRPELIRKAACRVVMVDVEDASTADYLSNEWHHKY